MNEQPIIEHELAAIEARLLGQSTWPGSPNSDALRLCAEVRRLQAAVQASVQSVDILAAAAWSPMKSTEGLGGGVHYGALVVAQRVRHPGTGPQRFFVEALRAAEPAVRARAVGMLRRAGRRFGQRQYSAVSNAVGSASAEPNRAGRQSGRR